MCHLGPVVDKGKLWDTSTDVSVKMASLKKAVDCFHFKNHRDERCHLTYNPWTLKKELEVDCINTPVCEQSFTWLNKYHNVKVMNQAHFQYFFLYMVDLHNLR